MSVDNPWLLAASGGSLLTLLIHVIAGGRQLVPPLLRANMPLAVRETHYYCWHLVSLFILALTLAFAGPLFDKNLIIVARIASAFAFAATAWNFVIVYRAWAGKFQDIPQWILFLPITICGVMGSFN